MKLLPIIALTLSLSPSISHTMHNANPRSPFNKVIACATAVTLSAEGATVATIYLNEAHQEHKKNPYSPRACLLMATSVTAIAMGCAMACTAQQVCFNNL